MLNRLTLIIAVGLAFSLQGSQKAFAGPGEGDETVTLLSALKAYSGPEVDGEITTFEGLEGTSPIETAYVPRPPRKRKAPTPAVGTSSQRPANPEQALKMHLANRELEFKKLLQVQEEHFQRQAQIQAAQHSQALQNLESRHAIILTHAIKVLDSKEEEHTNKLETALQEQEAQSLESLRQLGQAKDQRIKELEKALAEQTQQSKDKINTLHEHALNLQKQHDQTLSKKKAKYQKDLEEQKETLTQASKDKFIKTFKNLDQGLKAALEEKNEIQQKLNRLRKKLKETRTAKKEAIRAGKQKRAEISELSDRTLRSSLAAQAQEHQQELARVRQGQAGEQSLLSPASPLGQNLGLDRSFSFSFLENEDVFSESTGSDQPFVFDGQEPIVPQPAPVTLSNDEPSSISTSARAL